MRAFSIWASAWPSAPSTSAVYERHAAHTRRAFASGGGGLQNAIFERAKADVLLSVASAAAQRTAQALSTILSMQI
jgi:hypothetical protein